MLDGICFVRCSKSRCSVTRIGSIFMQQVTALCARGAGEDNKHNCRVFQHRNKVFSNVFRMLLCLSIVVCGRADAVYEATPIEIGGITNITSIAAGCGIYFISSENTCAIATTEDFTRFNVYNSTCEAIDESLADGAFSHPTTVWADGMYCSHL